ncbi:PREDICTED: tetraspanin-7-like [Calidris pugnax]|uniref:tetraspanin-7-like n=1 Tax=Calidris pugnax TaxID=198806 RepID=UPI00071DADF9|nr:PREDICTED: tetraspanin-7-like [Calidris pugnax]
MPPGLAVSPLQGSRSPQPPGASGPQRVVAAWTNITLWGSRDSWVKADRVSGRSLLYRQNVAQGFQEGLHQALLAYREDEEMADALDALQRALSCCGVEGYRDWLALPWGPEQNGSVPLSCCQARRGCQPSPPNLHGLHRDGCFSKVLAFVSGNMFYLATAALGLALLQLVGIVLACLLAARIPARRLGIATPP